MINHMWTKYISLRNGNLKSNKMYNIYLLQESSNNVNEQPSQMEKDILGETETPDLGETETPEETADTQPQSSR